MRELIQIIKKSLRFNESHIQLLLEDIPDEKIAESPSKGLENHPAWTLGHLCDAAGMICEMLDVRSQFPEGWIELYRRRGPGDPRTPSTDRSIYPATADVMNLYVKHHDLAIENIDNVSEEFLKQEDEWAFGSTFPSTIETIHFMASWHEANHISQLAAWRRAMGLPPCLRPLAVHLNENPISTI